MERTNVGGGRRLFYASLAFSLLLVALLPGCHDTLSVTDTAERQIDGDLAVLDGVELLVWDPDEDDWVLWDGEGPYYETRPGWRWLGDDVLGEPMFRYRLGGGEWRVLTEPENTGIHVFGMSGGFLRLGMGENELIYPGTYAFELQQRNAAGVWSAICGHDTVILVAPPDLDSTPGIFPTFSWEQWRDTEGSLQHGAYQPGRFSWRLERRNGEAWTLLRQESFIAQGQYAITAADVPVDGAHRFCVAEDNQGGSRSDYVCGQFVVDRTVTTFTINIDLTGLGLVNGTPPYFFDLIDAGGYGAPGILFDNITSPGGFTGWYDQGAVTSNLYGTDGVKINPTGGRPRVSDEPYRIIGVLAGRNWRLLLTTWESREEVLNFQHAFLSEPFIGTAGATVNLGWDDGFGSFSLVDWYS